jgi:hypothetical protein
MDGPHRAPSCRAISVPYGADSDGAWRSLTVTRVTLTCAHSHKEGDHTNGKDGVQVDAGTRRGRRGTRRATNLDRYQLWGKSSRQVVLGFWLLVFWIMEIGWRSGSARSARPLPASRPPPSTTGALLKQPRPVRRASRQGTSGLHFESLARALGVPSQRTRAVTKGDLLSSRASYPHVPARVSARPLRAR